MNDLEFLKNEVLGIAESAGQAILEIYHNEEHFGVEIKQDDSPLTIADKLSNEIICDGLKSIDPLYPIISEENQYIPFNERAKYSRCWIVDPLDGTKEFIKRNGEFTVNIALVENGRPILGIVGLPAKGELYWAIKGQGAFKLSEGKETQLFAKKYDPGSEGVRVVCSRSHLNEETNAFISKFKNPEQIAKGSALKFISIADGEADVYPRLAPTMEWDTAPADLILEEAGGRVIIADTQESMQYNKESLLNPHFIAFGK